MCLNVQMYDMIPELVLCSPARPPQILQVPPASQVPVYDKQVHDWCCRNGLQSVAHYLHFHKVDWPTMPYLTYEDLKEVGILHVGQRRKVMVALDELIEQLHRRGGGGAGYRR